MKAGMDEARTGRGRLGALMAIAVAAIGGGVGSPGCAEFDPTPVPVAQGSLGEEIVQVFCERMAADVERARPPGEVRDVTGARWKPVCEGREAPPPGAPPRLVALYENRVRLAEALDRTLPSDMTDDLGLFMHELLPFFDRPDERLPTQTRRLADFLTRLANDEEAVAALERLGTREGYRPLRFGLGVTRPVLGYPQFDEFAEIALRTLLDGSAREEFSDLQAALALEMAAMTIDPPPAPGEDTTLSLMRDLMFTEDDLFQTGPSRWVLMRDGRGIAQTDGVLAPFMDGDGDGLADVDSLGRFVGAGGAMVDVPGPFPTIGESGIARDASGRAIRGDGTRYFRYLDASRTMLAGTTAELAPWFDPAAPTLMQMSRGLPVLLGPPAELSETYGSYTHRYNGFDTNSGAMFDAVSALGELMQRDETYDALLVTEALLRDHESDVAGVMRSARYLANQSDLHPEAVLEQPNIFWDDLIEILTRIAQRPGMLEGLMRSFSDPRSAGVGGVYAQFMRNKDRVTYNPVGVNATPVGFPLDEPVNRAVPDGFDNESLWQRTLALIDGLNGVQVCNREGAVLNIRISVGPITVPMRWPLFGTAGECEIIRIDNVAEAYARSILGTYRLDLQSGFLSALVSVASTLGIDVDQALEEASGIDGMTQTPTPQALNRLVFWGLSDSSGVRSCIPTADGGNCNSQFAGQLFTPVIDRHGNDVIERYHGTIFAWELPGFYEGMQPMLEVLHQPGWTYDPSFRYFFGDLLGILHQHWGSRQNGQTCGPDDGCTLGQPNFSYQSNVRSYEPLVAEGFDEGQLTVRMQRLNLALEGITVRPGVDGVAALAAAGEVMIDPRQNPGLTDRLGRSTTTINDGSRTVPVTPLYLLLDALRGMDRAWEPEPARHSEWLTARRAMGEQFLGTRTLGSEFRMESQRGRAILLTALPFMRERLDAHRAAGDLVEWTTGLDERMADTMREPLMAALIRFLDAVNEDPESRAAMANLLGYLVNEASENDAFASTLYGGADALMVFEDDRNIVPLLNALSQAMAPNARDVVRGSASSLDLESSAVLDMLDLVRDIQEVDTDRTLRVVLQNASRIPDAGEEVTPLEVILDVIAEVNRASPNEGGSLHADDYRAVIGQTTDFILDEDHGLERLNLVVQNRQCFPEQGRACASPSATMDSAGLCYQGAQCRCNDVGGGALEWQCARP